MSSSITVAIVDDHPLVREGIVHVIDSCDDFSIVAQGETAQEAIQVVRDFEPDVLVLDLNIPGLGLEALREIGRLNATTKVVVLTVSEDEDDVFEALRCGASGYILKGISGTGLKDAVRKVHLNGSYISPELGGRILAGITRKSESEIVHAKKDSRLSEREAEIYRLIRQGYCNKEIGNSLNLSEKTVKYYLTNMFRKFDVRNRTELALLN